jgi:hypothetical protein
MSTQAEVNQHIQSYILYYCGYDQEDNTVYETDLSNVCSLSFDEKENIVVSDWQIVAYSAPSNATLLTYTLASVETWCNNFYTIPALIEADQPYSISHADLANIRADSSMIGYTVFDSTEQTNETWTGTAWLTDAERFLPRAGGKIDGSLGIATNDYGSGSGVLAIANASVTPSTSPTGGGVLYVQNGELKYRGSSGTVTVIAPA